MAQIKICKEPGCHNAATTRGYCRLHYLSNWKKIRDSARHRAAKKLNKYIEDVMSKHPDRYVEVIKEDLESPLFEDYIEKTYGEEEKEEERSIFEEPAYEEEIEELIKKFRIEKGF